MCKNFLINLFSHKPNNTGETIETAETETITVGSAATSDDENNTETDENETIEVMPTEKELERAEIKKKIVEYAAKMAEGKVRNVNQIAVHCTATKEGEVVTMEDIDKWHKARGFKKQKLSGHYCGYHYVVALDGSIMCGRDLSEIGAHVKDYNTPSIGVCYVGGLDKNKKAKDTRTAEQKETLEWLISTLKHELNINVVKGHRDYSPDTNNNGVIDPFERIKACPCFDAIPEYKNL